MSAKTRPKPGEMMPNFVLPDESGQLISLDRLLKKGPVAVTFHRGHWCPYCRINTRALAEAQSQIAAEGGQVAAIMPDREHFTAELKAESEAPFPILTDFDNGYALSLNLAFWVGAGDAGADDRGRLGRVAARKAPTPGCCRSLPPSSSAPTARSKRVSSIPTIASAWPSRICWLRSGRRARPRTRRRTAPNRRHAASSSWPKPRPCAAAPPRRKDGWCAGARGPRRRCGLEWRGSACCAAPERHPDARFEQGEKIAVGAHLMKTRDVEIHRPQHLEQRLGRSRNRCGPSAAPAANRRWIRRGASGQHVRVRAPTS